MAEYGHNPRNERPRQWGWLYATLIFVAFVGGAFMMKYILAGQSANGNPAAVPTPTVSAANGNEPNSTPANGQLSGSAVIAGGNWDLNLIPNIVKAVAPAVVGVNNYGSSPFGGGMQGSGSGVILSEDGYIVTNYHVVDGASRLTVLMPGGEEVDAKLVGGDQYTDLAVLKIEKTGLVYMELGDSDSVQAGELAIAIGNPLGSEFAGTVTVGFISAVNREVSLDESGYSRKMIQTDAAINSGNSGGALVNSKGQLIGINSIKISGTIEGATASVEGLGFAIPSNEVKPIVDELKSTGYVERPALGVTITQIVNENDSRYYGVPQGLVVEPIPGGAAEKAGVQKNDIIIEADGESATSEMVMQKILRDKKIGDNIQLKVWRQDGKTYDITVTLGSYSDLNRLAENNTQR